MALIASIFTHYEAAHQILYIDPGPTARIFIGYIKVIVHAGAHVCLNVCTHVQLFTFAIPCNH